MIVSNGFMLTKGLEDDLVVKTYAGYRMSIRAYVRGFWSGVFNYLEFYENMYHQIEVGFTQAWREGMESAGIPFSEISNEERSRLQQEITRERSYINRFANAIEQNSKANKGRLGPLLRRADQWAAAYNKIVNLAKTYAGRDKKYRWTIDAPKESCASCKKLNGKVKRASFWRARDLYPKNPDWLLCDGGCKCSLVETTDPVTRGPLPSLP